MNGITLQRIGILNLLQIIREAAAFRYIICLSDRPESIAFFNLNALAGFILIAVTVGLMASCGEKDNRNCNYSENTKAKKNTYCGVFRYSLKHCLHLRTSRTFVCYNVIISNIYSKVNILD